MAITIRDKFFLLEFGELSYAIEINDEGLATLLYFGKRLREESSYLSLKRKLVNSVGTSLMSKEGRFPSRESYEFFMPMRDLKCEPSFLLSDEEGNTHYEYRFKKAEKRLAEPIKDLPFPRGRAEELLLTFEETAFHSELILHYVLFEESSVLGRYMEVKNRTKEVLSLHRLASLSLFLPDISGYKLTSFHGSWANEFHLERRPLSLGVSKLETLMGSSSNQVTPYFYLESRECDETHGKAYGFSFFYSGSHESILERDVFSHLHLQMGIASTLFEKKLAPGESFLTPLALLSYSEEGRNGLSHNFHRYMKDHVLPLEENPGKRPIVYNNWEATMFSFNERKIHSLMNKAAKIGAELFVLDDGWFKNRNDDHRALGDWEVDKKKLPRGIEGLVSYAKKKGLRFGIWMEPEMVSPDSDLYRAHPDWALRDPSHEPLLGRNQLILDLRKEEVRSFIVEAVSKVLSIKGVTYLKWDYNRPFGALPKAPGSVEYDYMRGLYKVLMEIRKRFPKTLLENCASGGNRLDYGMMRFFNQSWLSDCTDSLERVRIEEGASYFFPLSVLSNHVSAKTNNQTLRKSSLESKFDVASFGVLGYEMDLKDLSPLEIRILKAQTDFYKKNRALFQEGEFSRISSFNDGKEVPARFQARYKGKTAIGDFRALSSLCFPECPLTGIGFDPNKDFRVRSRSETISLLAFGHLVNLVSPIHLAEEGMMVLRLSRRKGMNSESFEALTEGTLLNGQGVPLGLEWQGTGYDEGTRFLGDFGARLYLIEEEKEAK